MSDKYAALRAAAELAIADEGDIWWDQEQLTRYPDTVEIPAVEADFIAAASPATILELLAERDADKRRIAGLTAERDALREGEMGDGKHSNTRAAADIYFQLVEECEIPAGGSLVDYVDDIRDRLFNAEYHAAELDGSLCHLLPGVQYMDPPDGGSVTPLEQVRRMVADYREHIAELEARTLTVKLPDDGMDDCYDLWGPDHCRNNFDCGYNFSAARHEEAIREACAAAGLSLKIEGE